MKGLSTARKSAGCTQEQLAEKLGIAQSTVAMWETGKACPRSDMLPTIAEILGCTIDDLFAVAKRAAAPSRATASSFFSPRIDHFKIIEVCPTVKLARFGRTEADHCRELFIRLGERNLNVVHPFFDQFFCDFQKVRSFNYVIHNAPPFEGGLFAVCILIITEGKAKNHAEQLQEYLQNSKAHCRYDAGALCRGAGYQRRVGAPV